MLKQSDWPDRSAAIAILLGIVAVYLPWYSYQTGATHVAVNGLRASVLGDAFFLMIAAAALLVLMRHGVVADVLGGRISDRTARIGVAAAAAVVVLLQLALIPSGGRTASPGIVIALLSVTALAVSAWLPRYDAEPRRTVREMLGEELPD